jgi:xanthine dehydrogenase small subunit
VTRFILNNTDIDTSLPAGMVMLDFIRYHKQLTGTKIGCREGDCGACTVLVGTLKDGELAYRSMTSCLLPLANANNKHIVTVEGINMDPLNPIQQAMADEGATQCGFCTPGFVMSLAGFCLSGAEGTRENAVAAVDGNICRCTGYKSIERACSRVAGLMKERTALPPAEFVASKEILPAYFSSISKRLKALKKSNGQVLAPDRSAETIVGGGTDLYVKKHEEIKDSANRFFFDHRELNGIAREGDRIIVGAAATVTDLKNSPLIQQIFPSFRDYAWLVSSTPIRNMATIAGNFVNASPIGDFTILFLALRAQLTLTDGKNQRQISLRKFYKGYKQLDKKADEYIEQISFDVPGETAMFNFEKLSKRTNLDIATVNTAINISVTGDKIADASISAGGVGPVPLYLDRTSEVLKGKILSEGLVRETVETAQTEISPISDARGSSAYKRLLLSQLIKAHFIKLFPRLNGQKLLG